MKLKPEIEAFNEIKTVLDNMQLGDSLLDVRLAVEELFVNIVSYSKCTFIDFTAEFKDGVMTIELSDNGLPCDPTVKPPHEYDDELTLGGLGIDLACALMSKVVYKRRKGFNHLMLQKY